MKVVLRTPSRFKIAPEYAGLSADDLAAIMTPNELLFCDSWLACSGNGSAAVRKMDEITGKPVKYDVSNEHERRQYQRSCTQHAVKYYSSATVSTFLCLKMRDLRARTDKSMRRSFDAWLDQYEEMRDTALREDDIQTAIKAHVGLGKILGHITDGDARVAAVRDVSTRDLIREIADGDTKLLEALEASYTEAE